MHPFPFSKGLPLAEIQPRGEVGEGSRGTNLCVDRAKHAHHYRVLFSLTARQLSGASEGFLSWQLDAQSGHRKVWSWPGDMGESPAFCHPHGQGSFPADQTATTQSCHFSLKRVLRVKSAVAGPLWKSQEIGCKKLVGSPLGRGCMWWGEGTGLGNHDAASPYLT